MNAMIVSASGDRQKRMRLRVVSEPHDMARGLSFVDRLPDDEGMLFLMGGLQTPSFWMKDVSIPLDLAWLGSAADVGPGGLVVLRVVSVSRGVPHSLEALRPPAPCVAVLELAGGWFRRNGMGTGATLRVPLVASWPVL